MYAEQSIYEYGQYGGSPDRFAPSAYGPTNFPKPTSRYGIGSNETYQSEYGGYIPPASNYGDSGGGYGTGGGSYGGRNHYGNGTHRSYQKAGDYRTSSYGIQEEPAGMFSCQTEASNDPVFPLAPSSFPPGTDPMVINIFNEIDRDRNGFIDDKELQIALSNLDHRFSVRTVHLLMYMFTRSRSRTIGPKEFAPLLQTLRKWKTIFQRFDRDRNGRIDVSELREALCSLGCTVPLKTLNLLISKYDKRGGGGGKCSIEYDNFIEACLTVLGLTEKFKDKEDARTGTSTFTYDEFLLSVLPFIFT